MQRGEAQRVLGRWEQMRHSHCRTGPAVPRTATSRTTRADRTLPPWCLADVRPLAYDWTIDNSSFGIGVGGSTTASMTLGGAAPADWQFTADAGLSWVASTNVSWLPVNNGSGTGIGNFTVSVVPGGLAAGTCTGQVILTLADQRSTSMTLTLIINPWQLRQRWSGSREILRSRLRRAFHRRKFPTSITLGQTFRVEDGKLLRRVIRRMNCALVRAARPDCLLNRIQGEFRAHRPGNAPPIDPARERVDHKSSVPGAAHILCYTAPLTIAPSFE